MFGTVLQLWVMRFSVRCLSVAHFFVGDYNEKTCTIIWFYYSLSLSLFVGCSNDNDSSKSFKYHKDNLAALSTVVDSSTAEKMLTALEDSCAIENDTKLVKEDIIKYSNNTYELYAGLMVRFDIKDTQVKLYTFETTYSNNPILLYDSSRTNTTKVLSKEERNSLIYTQRRYTVHNTIRISPRSGSLLHNALGSVKIDDLTFTNRSDTALTFVSVIITPYLAGTSYSYNNSSYMLDEQLSVGASETRDLTKSGWSNYDSYKITQCTIAFADGTTIGFNEFDCQFLDGNGDSFDIILRDSQITYHLYNEQIEVQKFYSGFGNGLNTPYRYGYNFLGWYDNDECIGTPIEKIAIGEQVNIDLYAKWEEKNYIKYHYQYDDKEEKVYVEDGETPTITIPTRLGYTFNGWYNNTSFNGNAITEMPPLLESVELYAKWTGNPVYLTYDGNGSTSGQMSNQLFRVGDTLALNENKFSRDGYTFIGWSIEKTSNDIIQDKSEYTMQPTTYEAVKIYARWAKEIKTIADFNTINSNNAEHYTLLNDIDFENQKATTIEDFYGVFDGNGYTIKNSSTNLFTTNFGIIKNLTIENCSIATNYSGSSSGYGVSKDNSDLNGGFIAVNRGYIKNCSAKVVFSFYPERDFVGGFCGRNIGVIENSFSIIDITVKKGAYTVSGTLYLGGFVGENYEKNAQIINCYSKGNIVFEGNDNNGVSIVVGGFIGSSWDGKLERCYSNVSIDSSELSVAIGGFIGSGCEWLNTTKECTHAIKSCFAVGKINSGNPTIIGGFIGCRNDCEIIECYRNDINLFTSGTVCQDGILIQNEEFYIKEFYIENNLLEMYVDELTLQENENAVWIFEDGKLPKLYWETN